MASSPETKSSLDVLQLMLNDVLVQTGKALRASRKDSPGSAPLATGSARFKIPETMRTFHSSLDDLENEIIKAKGVLQRDISRLQENKRQLVEQPQPQSVEARSKSPMVIDLESSPVATKSEPVEEPESLRKTVAPFPDMGMDLSTPAVPTQGGSSSSQTPLAAVDVEPVTAPTQAAPVPAMTQGDLEQIPKVSTTEADASTALAPDLNFTNMEFALAAPENGQQTSSAPQEQFDLTAFAPADSANDTITLDNLVPQAANTNPTNNDSILLPEDSSKVPDQTNGSENLITNENIDDLLDMDFSGADGTDFDFSMDGNSFNELMTSHEGFDSTSMEHGSIDEAFFELDRTDGS